MFYDISMTFGVKCWDYVFTTICTQLIQFVTPCSMAIYKQILLNFCQLKMNSNYRKSLQKFIFGRDKCSGAFQQRVLIGE